MTNKLTRIASLLGVLTAVAGCAPAQPDPPVAPPSPTAAQEGASDTGGRLEADDPQAGTNTSRPDSPKDIQPEPGTPTPAP